MIDIVINNTKWSCPTTWEEVSIGKMIELETPTSRLSERVRHYVVRKEEPKPLKLTPAEKRELAQFYCNTLTILCGIPPATCAAIEPKQIAKFIDAHIVHLIAGILTKPLFTPSNILGFECQTEWFVAPKTEVDHREEQLPCAELSAEEFCLATDLYVANRVRNSVLIIATICRPEGEQYCRQTALVRAKAMEALPMSVAWEVFTLLTQAHRQMSKILPQLYSSRAEHRQNSTNRTSASWQQIPIIVARGVPSEVAAAQKMNCYQLMQMLALSATGKNNNSK